MKKGFLPVANGVRGPRLNKPLSDAEWRKRFDAETNERIARNHAPAFEGQERFGDDR